MLSKNLPIYEINDTRYLAKTEVKNFTRLVKGFYFNSNAWIKVNESCDVSTFQNGDHWHDTAYVTERGNLCWPESKFLSNTLKVLDLIKTIILSSILV